MKTFIDTSSIDIVDDETHKTVYDGDHEARCVVPSHWSETDVLIMLDMANIAYEQGAKSVLPTPAPSFSDDWSMRDHQDMCRWNVRAALGIGED